MKNRLKILGYKPATLKYDSNIGCPLYGLPLYGANRRRDPKSSRAKEAATQSTFCERMEHVSQEVPRYLWLV